VKRTLIEVYNFEQLVECLEKGDLSVDECVQVVDQGLKVFFSGQYETKSQFIQALCKYWDEWGSNPEKPLFIDIDGYLD
jgi:hypothetical protein